MRRGRRFAVVALSAALGSGCFAATNVDRFHEAAEAGPRAYDDLKFTLRGATAHVGHFFEYRVIDANNFIQSRGMVEAMPSPDVTLFAPRAVPRTNGPYRIDFWSDKSGLSVYQGLGKDNKAAHAWRINPVTDIPAQGSPDDGVFDIVYDHNTVFTDINEYPSGTPNPAKSVGGDAVVHFKNMHRHMEHLLQMRISESGTGHVIGIYRVAKLAKPDIDLRIPGVVDVDVDYMVDVYSDDNGNGQYDSPTVAGGDYGWRIPRTSNGSLELGFDPDQLPDHTVDVGPP